MSDFALSMLTVIVKTFATETIKAIVKALAKRTVSRTKERTAPTHNRDDSKN